MSTNNPKYGVYTKKPVEIEAYQIDIQDMQENFNTLPTFIKMNVELNKIKLNVRKEKGKPTIYIEIYTEEGIMEAVDGDYIVQGVKGEIYPVKKEIFEETYELKETK